MWVATHVRSWLRGWDSNPEPKDYSTDYWTMSSLRSSSEAGRFDPAQAGPTPFRDSLYTFPRDNAGAWLGVGRTNVRRIHPVFSLLRTVAEGVLPCVDFSMAIHAEKRAFIDVGRYPIP